MWSGNSAAAKLLNGGFVEGAKEIFALQAEMPGKLFIRQVKRYFVRASSERNCGVLG